MQKKTQNPAQKSTEQLFQPDKQRNSSVTTDMNAHTHTCTRTHIQMNKPKNEGGRRVTAHFIYKLIYAFF